MNKIFQTRERSGKLSARILIAVACLIIAAVIVLIGLRFLGGDEDTWICTNNQWTKHGNPASPMPQTGCGEQDLFEIPATVQDQPSATANETISIDDIINIKSLKPNDVISSPLEISGQARGEWFFEGVFPVKILDENDKIIVEGNAQAQGEWMTNNFVPFKAVLNFSKKTGSGKVVIAKDNPSGLTQNDQKIEIPVQFK
jgi:hypothetical protein